MTHSLQNSNNLFVLRSASSRRIQILKDLGIQFRSVPSEIDESEQNKETPLEYLERMVYSKLKTKDFPDINSIACDTIVVFQNKILHKPKDRDEAIEILSILSGNKHSVFSGAGLWTPEDGLDFFYEETEIVFKDLSKKMIELYIDRHNPYDKAGSYGIQDEGSPVAERIGSYTNVMGFPLRSFLQRIKKWEKFLKESV